MLQNPSDPEAYLNRGREYANLGAYDHAEQDFRKALELKHDLPEAYNELAWLYTEYLNDKLEEATELAQKGVQLAQRQPDKTLEGHIRDTLGWAYYKRGMVEEALLELEEAARLQPEDLMIQDHLEMCRDRLTSLKSAEA
jgi:Flp pilus assembly protein TadD